MPTGKKYAWADDDVTAEYVAPFSHGQTGYSHLDMAVYLATQFYDPATYKFLSDVFSLDGRDVWQAFTFDRFYQFVMRICARERDNETPFTIIAPDRACAIEISRLFGRNEEPKMFDLRIQEFREETDRTTPMSSAERLKKHREKKKDMKEDHESTLQYGGGKMVYWGNKYTKELLVKSSSWFDIAGMMEDQQRSYSPKNKSEAICFREGDILDEKNHKLVGTIQSTKLVILDMDIVKRDPQDLSDFLAENGWTHLIFNSFSSTPLEPYIRVVIGLSEAVNPANYLRIVNLLKADIDTRFGAGIYVVDDSKITINAKFHSPSVSEYKADLFIKRHITVDGQFELRFLDVRWFLSRNSVSVGRSIARDTKVERLAPVRGAVEDDHRSLGCGKGAGDR